MAASTFWVLETKELSRKHFEFSAVDIKNSLKNSFALYSGSSRLDFISKNYPIKYFMNFPLLFVLLICSHIGLGQDQKASLKQVWSTKKIFKTPESVFYDSLRENLYVANINKVSPDSKDGDGFISKLQTNGKVEKLEWITGLNDPKGMGMFGNTLYVADLDEIVEINIEKSEIVRKIKVEGSSKLNDVAVAKNGDIYISDPGINVVFKISEGVPLVWLGEDVELDKPNGLFMEEERLLVAENKGGVLNVVNPESKELREWVIDLPSADGIARIDNNNYFVSNWNGEIFYIDFKGSKQKILDTKDQKMNTADITVINSLNLLLAPTFYDNRVVAYEITILEP